MRLLSSIWSRFTVFVMAPWRRAPLLLARRPSVALAVAGAATVLGMAGAATPLYISSSSNAALHRQIEEACPWSVGPTVSTSQRYDPKSEGYSAAAFADRDEVMHRTGTDVPHVRKPKVTLISRKVPLVGAEDNRELVQLVSRPGFKDHIQVVAGGDQPGMWLHRKAAQRLGVGPGETVTVTRGAEPYVTRDTRTPVTLSVAGTFRELAPRRDAPFWCSMSRLIQKPYFSTVGTLPLAFVDQQTLLHLTPVTGLAVEERWEFRVRAEGLTVAEAGATTAALGGLRNPVYRGGGPVISNLEFSAQLPQIAERARLVGSSVSSSVGPVAVAGIVVALLLTAAAGSYWVDRRRREVELLVSRGVGPVPLAVKAVLETAAPLIAGTAAGWALAVLVVTWLGPSSLLSAGAPAAALAAAAGALVVAACLLGVVVALRTRASGERSHGARRHWAARVPWELGFLAVTGVLLAWLVSGGTTAGTVGSRTGTVAQVDPLLLAFPLVFLAGAVSLAVRLLGPGIRRLAAGGSDRSVPAYLAARRVGAAPRGTLMLLAATAVPIGVLVYAASLTSSVRETVDAKVELFAGADVTVKVEQGTRLSAEARAEATRVIRLDDQSLNGQSVTVLGVDPATFPRDAYWRDTYASRPLPELMSAIRYPGGDQPVPVLVANSGITAGPATLTLTGPDGDQMDVAATVAETSRYFPGQRSLPIVAIDQRALRDITDAGFPYLWARGEEQRIITALNQAGVDAVYTGRASDIYNLSNFLAVSYTFRFLTALALLIGVVGVVGLLLYLEARSRARRVFYVLARRMGLSRRTHLGSLLLELGGLFSAGLAIGSGLAWVAVLFVYRRLDVDPRLPPGPLLPVPVGVLLAVAATVGVIAVVAGVLAQYSADRARAAEVLRAAE